MSDLISYNPWHGDPGNAVAPHRPSLAQLGGGAFQDDQSNPPDLDTMPSAAMENVNEKTLAGIAAVTSVAGFTVKFAAGAPYIDKATFADSSLDPGDITVTDNGTGDTSLTWAAGTFPTAALEPTGLTIHETHVTFPCAYSIANGVRVKTLDSLGNGADVNFSFELK